MTKLIQINTQKTKAISTFDFTILYTTIPHKLLIKALSEVIKFYLQIKDTMSNWLFENINLLNIKRLLKKILHKTSFDWCHLISHHKILFYHWKPSIHWKQDIGIPMGIDLAPYWASSFLYLFESRYVQQSLSQGSPRAYNFHGTSRFIDDISTINDDGEFSSSYKYIYPKQLELKF